MVIMPWSATITINVPFGHAAAEKAELSVNALVRADPFVGIPTVIVPDLIGVPQIQICQTGRFCRLRRGCNPFSRIIVGNVVAARSAACVNAEKANFGSPELVTRTSCALSRSKMVGCCCNSSGGIAF